MLLIHRKIELGSVSIITLLVSLLLLMADRICMLLPILPVGARFTSAKSPRALYDLPCALQVVLYLGLVNTLIFPLQNLQNFRQNPTEYFKCNRQGVSWIDVHHLSTDNCRC